MDSGAEKRQEKSGPSSVQCSPETRAAYALAADETKRMFSAKLLAGDITEGLLRWFGEAPVGLRAWIVLRGLKLDETAMIARRAAIEHFEVFLTELQGRPTRRGRRRSK